MGVNGILVDHFGPARVEIHQNPLGLGQWSHRAPCRKVGGGCRDPPSGPHRIPVAQLHPAIQLTQRNGSASVSPGCVGAHQDGEAGWGGQGTSLELPPQPTPVSTTNKRLSAIKTNMICHWENLQETVYPLLEQRSAVIREFLDYIFGRVEGKGDPVFEGSSGLCFWMAQGHARLAAELSPDGAGVEDCVTRRDSILSQKAFDRP